MNLDPGTFLHRATYTFKQSFIKVMQRENSYIYQAFGITIVPAESVTRERLFVNDVDLPLGK